VERIEGKRRRGKRLGACGLKSEDGGLMDESEIQRGTRSKLMAVVNK